jgi:hypothetical protein
MHQFTPTYGSTAATDWEKAAVPAQTAPAAFHRDWLVSAGGIAPAPCQLAFVVNFANVVVADCSQNPAAGMENTQTPNCRKS